MRSTSVSGTDCPSMRSMPARRRRSFAGWTGFGYSSINPPRVVPAPICSSSAQARSMPAGGADARCTAGQLGEIERVHRLAELEQHVIRDVDDVVDGPHAASL